MAELLRSGRRKVYDVWMAEGVDQAPILAEIVREAERRGVPIRHTARPALEREAATEAPQGVLAHAAPLSEADFDDLCRPARRPARPPAPAVTDIDAPAADHIDAPDAPADAPAADHTDAADAPVTETDAPAATDRGDPPAPQPFLLALDGVTDPRNVGALLRSADGAGATGAVLPRRRAAHVTPAVTKAAAGAIEHVPLAIVAGMASALARAKELGCWVVGLADDGDTSLFDLTLATEPLVLVVGSEGEGLSRLVRQRCDVVASIPMAGSLPSLNVAAAGTLALYEVARRRRTSPNGGHGE